MYPELRQGDQGEYVELLQRVLRDLGYEVGAVDGDFGPVTLAALEAYQDQHSLSHNEPGFVGPDTWASFESQFGPLEGLRTSDSMDSYVRDTYGIMNSSMSTEDRLQAMEAEVNDELTAAGVPYVEFVIDPATPPHAQFDFATWTAQISPKSFDSAAMESMSSAELSEIAGVIYHESRHAEQWWDMARLLAGLHGRNGQQIHDETGIKLEVAEQAAANPILECTTTNGPAFDWYESVYGAGSPHREAVLGTLGDGDNTNDRYQEYRGTLPEEEDSHEAGGSIARKWHQYETGGETLTLPTLQRGDQDEEVGYLQQLLQWRGYYQGAKDNDFGPITEEAVRNFQRDNGLTVDGFVGQLTWNALIP